MSLVICETRLSWARPSTEPNHVWAWWFARPNSLRFSWALSPGLHRFSPSMKSCIFFPWSSQVYCFSFTKEKMSYKNPLKSLEKRFLIFILHCIFIFIVSLWNIFVLFSRKYIYLSIRKPPNSSKRIFLQT
jgi:hypothetical protein